jgi:hypothetical protein
MLMKLKIRRMNFVACTDYLTKTRSISVARNSSEAREPMVRRHAHPHTGGQAVWEHHDQRGHLAGSHRSAKARSH